MRLLGSVVWGATVYSAACRGSPSQTKPGSIASRISHKIKYVAQGDREAHRNNCLGQYCQAPANRFNSQLHHEFKSAYEPLLANAEIKTIEVNLSKVSYLDSGALGLLVLLDSSANNRRKTISIISVPGPVAKVLKLANVDKLFQIKLPSGVKFNL